MIGLPTQEEPAGYRIRTFQRAVDPDDRDGALVLESPDDDMIAMAVVDVIAETSLTVSVVDQVCATIVDKPSQLKSPLQLLESLNRQLCGTPGLGFVSLLVAVLDTRRHRLTISNAGGFPGSKRTKQGSLSDLGVEGIGLPVGMDPGMQWECIENSVEIGDTLILMGVGMVTSLGVDNNKEPTEQINKMVAAGGGVDAIAQRFEQALDQLTDPEQVLADQIYVLIERLF